MRVEQWQAVLSQLRQELAAVGEPAAAPKPGFQQLLTRACQIPQIAAGIVWLLDEQARLRILCEHQLPTLAADGRFEISPRHQQQLAIVLREGQATCLPLESAGQGLPHCLVAMGPLLRGAQPIGVLELISREALSAEAQAVLVRAVEDLCEIGSELLAPEPPGDDNPLAFWERFDRFSLQLQRSLDVDEVAAIAASDGLVMLGCDRLSIAVRHGRRTLIRAISGQEKVDRRSNLARAMAVLADQAINTGEVVTYSGTVEGLAPQLEQPLSNFVLESRCRMVLLVPLRQAPGVAAEHQDAEAGQRPRPLPVIGCLVVEQMTDSRPRATVTRRIDLVTDHVAAALTNARAHSDLFLLPLWRRLGRGWAWLRGRRMGIAAAIAAGVATVIAALILVPWDYRVEGEGLVMPAIQREVFAPWDGDVKQLLAASGQQVAAGDLLLVIESDDLDAEHVAARNEVIETEKLVATLTSEWQTAQRQTDREKQAQLLGELTKARVEHVAAQEKEQKLAERIAELSVRAPLDGTVVTFQLKQNLLGRPVRRGEALLEIMDETGPWRLELEVPEYRMGHVLRALADSELNSLPVEYVPATAVEQTHAAVLSEVGSRSNVAEEQGTVVEVFADIDPQDLPDRRIGAEVTAKINCGRSSLGYALFGDVIEFLQRMLWF
ncbi:MAG: HlyD family efflux transporter periplasmic adaptor subunit [Planctomycetaceae bacterium]|nr:HlyD family efflux transporter periplasmic adaptor subunit [Planctomycetaceae bacterium]